MAKSKEIDKGDLVKREINRLTKLFSNIESNRRLTAKGLIEEASFMKATLVELKGAIDANGPIDEMPQGDYSILREHPALKSYNTMVKNYTSIIDKLLGLLPKEVRVVESDAFDEFINNRAD